MSIDVSKQVDDELKADPSIKKEMSVLKKETSECKATCMNVLTEVLKAVSKTPSGRQNEPILLPSSQSSSEVPVDQSQNIELSDILRYLKSLPPVTNLDVQDVCTKVEKLLETTKSLEERWSSLDSKIDNKIESLQDNIFSKIEEVKSEANDREQYSKNYNLLFHGLRIPYHLKGLAFSKNISMQINHALPYLNPKVTSSEIDISHPINFQGKPGVIVRFVRRDFRNYIFFCHKYLQNGVKCYEHLTKMNKDLLTEAKEIVGEGNAWFAKGELFVSLGRNHKRQFKSLAELNDLLKKPEITNGTGTGNVANNININSKSYSQVLSQVGTGSPTSIENINNNNNKSSQYRQNSDHYWHYSNYQDQVPNTGNYYRYQDFNQGNNFSHNPNFNNYWRNYY